MPCLAIGNQQTGLDRLHSLRSAVPESLAAEQLKACALHHVRTKRVKVAVSKQKCRVRWEIDITVGQKKSNRVNLYWVVGFQQKLHQRLIEISPVWQLQQPVKGADHLRLIVIQDLQPLLVIVDLRINHRSRTKHLPAAIALGVRINMVTNITPNKRSAGLVFHQLQLLGQLLLTSFARPGCQALKLPG